MTTLGIDSQQKWMGIVCERVLELGSVLEGVEGDDSVVVIGGEEHRWGIHLGGVDVV